MRKAGHWEVVMWKTTDKARRPKPHLGLLCGCSGAQARGPFTAVFPGALAGSWIKVEHLKFELQMAAFPAVLHCQAQLRLL